MDYLLAQGVKRLWQQQAVVAGVRWPQPLRQPIGRLNPNGCLMSSAQRWTLQRWGCLRTPRSMRTEGEGDGSSSTAFGGSWNSLLGYRLVLAEGQELPKGSERLVIQGRGQVVEKMSTVIQRVMTGKKEWPMVCVQYQLCVRPSPDQWRKGHVPGE